jgi:hypothetical protein
MMMMMTLHYGGFLKKRPQQIHQYYTFFSFTPAGFGCLTDLLYGKLTFAGYFNIAFVL